jgi:hypothetical protein
MSDESAAPEAAPEAEESQDPLRWELDGKRVHFRHILMVNGQRVTFAFVRVFDYTDHGDIDGPREFDVTYSRYNPVHEPKNYTKSRARAIAFERLRKGNGAVKRVDIPRGNEQTYATNIVNSFVAQGILPSSFRATTAVHAKRFRDYAWDDVRGLVRITVPPE